MSSVPSYDVGFISLLFQRNIRYSLKIDFLDALVIISTTKTYRRKFWPELMKHVSVYQINRVKVTECDNSLYLLFPDIPWQLFGRVSYYENITGPWFYDGLALCTRNMSRELWRLEKACSGGGNDHVCPYRHQSWIINNEYGHRELNRTPSLFRKKVRVISAKSRYERLCLGHSPILATRTSIKTKLKSIDGNELCEPINHKVKFLKTRISTTKYKDEVPPKIMRMRELKHKQDKSKVIYDVTPESLKCFDVRETIVIHHSVLPSELGALLTLIDPAVRSLTYWRISELNSETLVSLKLIFSNLRCLKGFYIPGSPIKEIFIEEWHSEDEMGNEEFLKDLLVESYWWETNYQELSFSQYYFRKLKERNGLADPLLEDSEED